MRLVPNLPAAIVACAAVLAGCGATGPDYRRPDFDLPPAQPARAAPDLRGLWDAFDDPVLDGFLHEAARNNQDLALAAARVEEARALARVSASGRYPSVNAALGVIRFPTLDSTVGGVQTRTAGEGGSEAAYQLALTATYEIDFWGRLSRADEAARARLLAQDANRRLVRNNLYVSLVETYVSLRAFDAQVALAESTRRMRHDALRLQQVRSSAGSASMADLYRAEAAAALADLTATQARQSVALTEALMAVLLGRSPAAISAPDIARGADISTLHLHLAAPPDLPSDLLNRRPDILRAEQGLVAAHADVGQARAAYFPTVKLGAALGSASALSSPTELLWNLGAGLFQPLFNGGALDGAVQGAQARQSQALADYVKTVQNAFRDVHDALVRTQAGRQAARSAQERAAALQQVADLSAYKYERGYISYQDLVETQLDLYQAQAAVIDAQRGYFLSLLGLYRAVGGNWNGERQGR